MSTAAVAEQTAGPLGSRAHSLDAVLRKLLGRLSRSRRRLLVPFRERSDPAKIAVKSVGHTYRGRGEVVALENVNLDIHHGQMVCLLGPSGCGKSTLLYALAGTVEPSGGHVTIDGKEVRGPSPNRLLMFQDHALFPWLTVRQNIIFALRARKLDRRECGRRAHEFIHLVQLDGFEHALPHQLSGGMRQRASLARALSMDPAVLLMDEPFGALDAQTRAQMHTLLQHIWMRTRKTVVFVTHDIREALVLGDRVVVMAGRPGRILQDLEVRLERPRDPDDERLVTLSRQISAALREAQAQSRPMSGAGGEGRDDEDLEGAGRRPGLDGRAAAGGVPGGAGTHLGTGG
ncbi:MAG TPA: ABC transporter ATP-binding protein [Myxococcaceae bacterium]|jgi:NitT/TauT family transport system ATP-binding protein